MAHILKANYSKMFYKKNELSEVKIQFGDQLCIAQNSFLHIKRKQKLKVKWTDWVTTNTEISIAHVKRLVYRSHLFKHLPKAVSSFYYFC